MLTQVAYISTVSEGINYKEVKNILEHSQKYNAKKNITGLMAFTHKYFLQVLEGERLAVSNLYNKIANDKRHQNVTIIHFNEINMREFSEWSMGYLPSTKMTSALNLKYSHTDSFCPYEMTSMNLMGLIRELNEYIDAVMPDQQ